MTAISTDNTNGFSERYGVPSAIEPANVVVQGLLNHRSVRAYTEQPLSAGMLEQLMAAAQSASSSSNLQLWSALVVQDQERRKRLADICGGQKHICEAPLFIVWLADLSRAERVGKAQGVTLEALDYTESFMLAVIDAALAAQNAVVAAESMGLGVVYIGAMRNNPQAIAMELGLPPHVMGVFGLCIGWPDPDRPASVKPRLPLSVVLHNERYGAAEEDAAVAAYDESLKRFQHGQGMDRLGWSSVQIARLRTEQALGARAKMRSSIHELGLALR